MIDFIYETETWVAIAFFFFQAEDGIRDRNVTGVQTCALPIYRRGPRRVPPRRLPLQPRGTDPGVRARAHPDRQPHRAAVRRLRALRLDRRTDPPARRRARRARQPEDRKSVV